LTFKTFQRVMRHIYQESYMFVLLLKVYDEIVLESDIEKYYREAAVS